MRCPAIEAMLTMAPPPRARICGSTARIPLKAPVRLTAMTRSQSSAPISPIIRRTAVAAGELRGDSFGRRRIAIENRDSRSGYGEGAASRGADPIAAAGDEYDLSAKIFCHLSNSVIAARGRPRQADARQRIHP